MDGLKEALEYVTKELVAAVHTGDLEKAGRDSKVCSDFRETWSFLHFSVMFAITLRDSPPESHAELVAEILVSGFLLGVLARAELEDRQLNEILEQQYGDADKTVDP